MMAEDLDRYKNALYLSLNNTLGGAFCIDGKLILGENQKAGEFGHMILVPGGKKCYCGKLGCADAYCAASVLTDETHQTLEQFMAHLKKKGSKCRRDLAGVSEKSGDFDIEFANGIRYGYYSWR